MTDQAFGGVPKDQTYTNLNVKQTLGQCDTKIRARCIASDTVTADTLIARQVITTEAFESGVVQLATSNIFNMTGLDPFLNAMFSRIGSIVTLSFAINDVPPDVVRIQLSGGGFQLEIPVPSNFTNDFDASGVLSNDDTNNQGTIAAIPGSSRISVLIDTDMGDYPINRGRGIAQYVVK